MQTFTASIELDADQAALMATTAAYYRMDVQTFLTAALTSGIAHAEESMDWAETSGVRATMPTRSAYPHGLALDMDDGIPF